MFPHSSFMSWLSVVSWTARAAGLPQNRVILVLDNSSEVALFEALEGSYFVVPL